MSSLFDIVQEITIKNLNVFSNILYVRLVEYPTGEGPEFRAKTSKTTREICIHVDKHTSLKNMLNVSDAV